MQLLFSPRKFRFRYRLLTTAFAGAAIVCLLLSGVIGREAKSPKGSVTRPSARQLKRTQKRKSAVAAGGAQPTGQVARTTRLSTQGLNIIHPFREWQLSDRGRGEQLLFNNIPETDSTPELDGPDEIRERVRDYLRRHGLDRDYDPNRRLELIRDSYEARQAEITKAKELQAIAGSVWHSIGPTNGAGRMTAVAVHPTIDGTIYVGAAGGGVWKTTNGGASWIPLTDSITDLFVGALAIAPSSPNTIYLGTGEGNIGTPGFGLLKSTDGGTTWQFPSTVIANSFYKISVHPTNANELIVGTPLGALRSTNGGSTWTTVIPSDTTDIIRDPTNPQILYATSRPSQVSKSTDGGITWVNKSSGLPVQTLGRLSIAINRSTPSILYVAGATNDTISHIFKTTNGGDTWVDLPGISGDPNLRFYFATYNQSWYDNTLVVSPFNPNIILAGGVSYVRSTDGGNTWSFAFTSGGGPHVDAHDLQYQGSTLYIANDGGIWSSTDDGQSAVGRNSGLVTRQYYTVANDPINRNRVFGGTQDNGTGRRSDAGGTDWTNIIGGDGFDCAVNPYAPEVMYGTIQFGQIHRTRNAGTTSGFFNMISPNFPQGEPGAGPFFTTLTMDPNNPAVLYTGSYRVWKTTNGGDTWSPLPTTTTDGSSWPTFSIGKIAVAPSDSRILMVSHGTTMFRSTDGGLTWVSAANGLPFSNNIEIDPQNPAAAYAASFSGMYATSNAGATWTLRNTGLPQFSVHVVRVDPTDSNVLFCGTDVGVYRSVDQGMNWTKFGSGLPNVSVYDMRILSDGSALRIATHGRAMWELQIPSNGNTAPSATLTNPQSDFVISKGTKFTLQGSVSDPDPGDSATGIWFFQDSGEVFTSAIGSTSREHVFDRTGTYVVSLTAKDTHGALASAVRNVTVTETFDSCATPLVIPNNGPFPLTVTANKEGATRQATDPATPCLGNFVSRTLWYEFTPSVSGVYQFETKSSFFVPEVISLWRGPSCGPYTAVPLSCSFQESSPVSSYIAAGDTVRIMLSSQFESDTGSVSMTVNKLQECSFTFDASNKNFPANGGEGTVSSTSQAGCGAPPISSNDSWITIIPGTSRYIVAANYDSQPRSGSLKVAGQTVMVQQSGATTACAPRPSGLIAWWRADGNALDQIGANHGALTNKMSYAGGKIGGGFLGDFNHNGGAVEVPDSPSLALNKSMTFEGWLRVDSTGGTIIKRTDVNSFVGSYEVSVISGGVWFIIWYTDSSGVLVWSDPVTFGQFVHFAASLDDATGEFKVYINGALQRQLTITQRPNVLSNARVSIGDINGVTDELSVYNRALSASEIQSIYAAGVAPTGPAGKCLSTSSIQVTTQTNPAGRSYSVDGTTYTSTQTFTWSPGSSHTIGTTTPQNGTTGTRFVWNKWSDSGAISHTVTPTSNTTFTADFTTQHFLTMSSSGNGTVSPASGWFNSGTKVSISASPSSGFLFNNWTGSGAGSFSGPANPATVTVNGPISEAGNFLPEWQSIVLLPTQVEMKSWTFQGRSYVYLKLNFPSAGYRVADWGAPTHAGNAYSVNATIERFNGLSAQVISNTAQIYDLGPLSAGDYTFTFKNSGTTVKTLNFTVSGTAPPPNPIDDAREFVRWQYKDYLRREPDGPGWDHWTGEITECGNVSKRFPGETEPQCVERKRANTSAAFFLSPEFQNTGYFVLRVYRGSLGRMPHFGGGNTVNDEFTRDAGTVSTGIVVNDHLAPNVINANKQAYVQEFVTRSEFRAIYDGLNNMQFVDRLFQTTAVTPTAQERQALIDGLTGGSETRASVLFKVVDGTTTITDGHLEFNTNYGKAFYDKLFNAAFVQMEYFGYLLRDPDPGGYAFWLGKLNSAGNWVDAQMVLAFIKSPEYRSRFGAP